MNWNEEAHISFYQSLRSMEASAQSKAILDRAGTLLRESGSKDELKAVESLLTFWKLNLRWDEDKSRAEALFYHLYQRMGDPDKASNFRPLGH
jgi:hypothetical protein